MHILVFIVPILVVVVIYVARMVELGTLGVAKKSSKQEGLTLLMFAVAGALMFFGSLLEYVLMHKTFSWPMLAAGVVLAVVSFKIRRSAIRALGKFWSLHVEIQNEHEFITTGPFRWVRHPTYLSMILELIAVGLALQAYLTMLIVIPFLFFPALLYRLKTEEAALVEKFGQSYRDYQEKIPALFPTRTPLPK